MFFPPRLRLCFVVSQWIAALALLASPGATARADDTLVPVGSVWKYLDNGTNLGTSWKSPSYPDTTWKEGPAELGYGDGDEKTVVGYGPNASAKYVTTYFRRVFNVGDPAAYAGLKLRLLRDDGAVVYLNGTEVRRDNMPTGTVAAGTFASTALGAPAETTFYESTLPTGALTAGANVLAVEIHQANLTSTDLSFDLELIGVAPTNGAPVVTRGPYLQKATPTQITLRWRTDVACDSVVKVGVSAANLNQVASIATATTEHEVLVTNLLPNTQYYYSIGSSTGTLVVGSEYSFFTPPTAGTSVPTRIWVLGDSGTGGDGTGRAESVRNAYATYAAGRYTDVWLMLGDNAYEAGLDSEFQRAVFDMYPAFLRQTALWSALGNHETAQATTVSDSLPYLQMFSFPTQGEGGGVPSGTKKYYSFDHGDIHFICLDSMTSSRLPGSPMLTWLQNDLSSTTQRWIIAFWHHPPYTKGSHDSDVDPELTEMRKYVLPILEAGGVDLVLGGHSHCYERSMLINGHYGLSSTFSAANAIDHGNGSETGTGAYQKPGGLSSNQGAVYAVAGSSGKATNWTGGSTATVNPNPHPVMATSLLQLGSLVIDVDGARMDMKFLRETGAVADSFTILKQVPNTPPTVAISSPVAGTSFTTPVSVGLTAAASDADGSVVQVDFYSGSIFVGTATSAPFSITWQNVPAGNYVLTASATDDRGATTTSAPVNITVTNPPPPPNVLPTVVIASPAAGSSYTAPATIAVSASAADSDGSVARVDFYAGANLIGSSTSAPYAIIWANVTAGTCNLTAVATDNAGGRTTSSAVSIQVSAAPTPTAPAAPSSLVARAVSKSSISLSWADNSANEDGFRIERSSNGRSYTQIATVAAGATGFADSALAKGKTYYYRVRSYNAVGTSAYSNVAQAVTLSR